MKLLLRSSSTLFHLLYATFLILSLAAPPSSSATSSSPVVAVGCSSTWSPGRPTTDLDVLRSIFADQSCSLALPLDNGQGIRMSEEQEVAVDNFKEAVNWAEENVERDGDNSYCWDKYPDHSGKSYCECVVGRGDSFLCAYDCSCSDLGTLCSSSSCNVTWKAVLVFVFVGLFAVIMLVICVVGCCLCCRSMNRRKYTMIGSSSL